jgi:hypothetical protein
MIDTICPLYQSEISPMHTRGRMVGTHAALLVMGYVSAHLGPFTLVLNQKLATIINNTQAGASWVGLGCYFAKNSEVQWRLCIALQLVAPFLLLLGSPWIPESPRYLIYNNRTSEVRSILQKLHYTANGLDHSFAENEFEQICGQVKLDREHEMPFLALWKNKGTRKRLLLGFFVVFAAQSSGVQCFR